NRFRPLAREHWINPVLYLEYENINEASRIRKEIVGAAPELNGSNAELRATQAHELETKLILSSTAHNWNISENFIVEKNLTENEGFEFGYALAVARPLATLASGKNCRFCRENFIAGVELYGGLGTTQGFGLHDTAHYARAGNFLADQRQHQPAVFSCNWIDSWQQPGAAAPRLQLRNSWIQQQAGSPLRSEAVKLWILLTTFVLLSGVLAQNTAYQPDPDWHVPQEAAAKPNPLACRPEAAAAGKKLFLRNCTECH